MVSLGLPVLGVQLGSSVRPEDLPRVAAEAEQLGFRHLWVAENYFSLGGIASLAEVLHATETAIIGLGVVASVARHPAVTAMEFAHLARAYAGRLMLGIGHGAPGWVRQMGLYPESPLTALEECVTAVRALLGGETMSREGRYFSFERIRLEHPLDAPVPIFTGVEGRKSLELSGRIADGTLLGWFSSPAYVQWAKRRIGDEAAAAGRGEHQIVTLAVSALGDPSSAAVRRIREFAMRSVAQMASAPQVTLTGMGDEVSAWDGSKDVLPGESINQFALTGAPDRCATGMQRLLDSGSDAVVLVPNPAGLLDLDELRAQLTATAETLLPRFS